MKPAADKMEEKINQTNFLKPKIEIISNVTTKPEKDPATIKKLFNFPNFLNSKMERKYN